MSRDDTLHTGLRVAGLGAAATTGALIGFGVRRGAPVAVLSAAGDRLRGLPAFVAPDRSLGPSALLGLAHHLALVIGWALLFALVAVPMRGPRRGAARAVLAALVATVAVTADALLPSWLCLSAGVASAPQRALLALALAASLLAGMPLAQQSE